MALVRLADKLATKLTQKRGINSRTWFIGFVRVLEYLNATEGKGKDQGFVAMGLLGDHVEGEGGSGAVVVGCLQGPAISIDWSESSLLKLTEELVPLIE